ncbi:MAG: DUF5062 family protein [Methylococcales bacterium]
MPRSEMVGERQRLPSSPGTIDPGDRDREAIRVGMIYAEKCGLVKLEATDSARGKIRFLYRLLIHDELIQPLAKDQENKPNMKPKLVLWISRQLSCDHPLLKD